MDLLQACCDSRDLLERIFGCIQVPILVTSLEGEIIFANPAVKRAFKFTPEELMGRTADILFTPEDLTYFYPNLLFLAAKNKPFEGDIILHDKDHARFSAFISLHPCFESGENKTIIVLMIYDRRRQDVPQRPFKEDHYEDLVRIANGIAHELRNPLVSIGGFVNRLYKSCRHTADHDTYYAYIVSNLKKIEALVRKVEAFASLPKPSFSESFLDDLAKRALEPFHELMEKRGVHLSVSLEKVSLFLDESLVIRAFSVLIDNAIDALRDGGNILITNETKNNHCTVTIADTGCGIAPKDLPFVFNPFFSTKPDGVGIDLALVKRIMESHGGRVEVSSKQNEGTSFQLVFPLERRRALRITPLGD